MLFDQTNHLKMHTISQMQHKQINLIVSNIVSPPTLDECKLLLLHTFHDCIPL